MSAKSSILKRVLVQLHSIFNNRFLALFDGQYSGRQVEAASRLQPIFILGPPRCGSTLVMQAVTNAYEFGYLTNAHSRWFGAPWLAEVLLRPMKGAEPSDYKSHHGRTKKRSEPSECGAWWYRFFPAEPAFVRTKDVPGKHIRAFQRSIASLHRVVKRPLIFKNLYAGLRLEPIIEAFPNAIFVVIERSIIDNAQSILKGRKDALGGYEPWWSVPPPDVETLRKLGSIQQVVGQIESINVLINDDLRRLGAEARTFRIGYEAFCNDVHGTLSRFESFMDRQSVILQPRFSVPPQFEIPRSKKIPERMYKQLHQYITNRSQVDGYCIAEVKK